MNMPPIKPLPKHTIGDPWYKKVYKWFCRRKWVFWDDYNLKLPDGSFCFIPKGFVLDLASIPRIFWTFLSPIDLLLIGSIPHDFGYRHRYLIINGLRIYFTRKELDDLFKDITIFYTDIKTGAWIGWFVVRTCGWRAWWKNNKRRKRG